MRELTQHQRPRCTGRHHRLRCWPDVRRVRVPGRHEREQGHRSDRYGRRTSGRGGSAVPSKHGGHFRHVPQGHSGRQGRVTADASITAGSFNCRSLEAHGRLQAVSHQRNRPARDNSIRQRIVGIRQDTFFGYCENSRRLLTFKQVCDILSVLVCPHECKYDPIPLVLARTIHVHVMLTIEALRTGESPSLGPVGDGS